MAKKFEYRVFKESKLVSGYDCIEEGFVQLGQEGWELVGINPNTGGSSTLYFKREIDSPLNHKQEKNGYDVSR